MDIDKSGNTRFTQNNRQVQPQKNFLQTTKPRFQFEELRTTEIDGEIIQNFDEYECDIIEDEDTGPGPEIEEGDFRSICLNQDAT